MIQKISVVSVKTGKKGNTFALNFQKMSTGMNHSNSVNFHRNFHVFHTNGQRSMPLFHSNKKGFGLGPTLKVTVWETQISPFCPISACTLFHQPTILTAFSLIRGNVNSTQLR